MQKQKILVWVDAKERPIEEGEYYSKPVLAKNIEDEIAMVTFHLKDDCYYTQRNSLHNPFNQFFATHWLKETEAVVLSEERLNKIINLAYAQGQIVERHSFDVELTLKKFKEEFVK